MGLWARLGLTRDELARTAPITVAYALVLASLYLLKPARNALFLNRQGIAELPFVLLLVAVVGGLTAAIYGKYAKATRIDRLIRYTFVLLVGFLIGFRYLLTTGWGWVVYAFYIWVALYGLLTTSLVWLLANAIFTSREARKVFGFIGTGGIAGAILGGLFTGYAADLLGTENLLLVCAGVLGVVVVLLYPLRPSESTARRRRGKSADRDDGIFDVLRSDLLRNLALTAGLVATVAVIVDIQFNEIVDRVYPDEDTKTAFFGTFFAYLSGFGFLFQLFVTPYLLRTVGVGAAIMILPVAMGLGSTAILIAPGLFAAIMAKGADGGFRHSVHKAASEVLFLPVPAEAKSQAKLFLDTTVDTTFTGLGALLVLLLTGPAGLSHDKLSFVTVPLVCLVVFVALRMRRAYVDAFRSALERRELDLEDLRTNLDEAGVVGALLPALDSDNERQVVYALDLLASARSRAVVAPVQKLAEHPSAEVRAKALRVLRHQGASLPEEALEALLEDPNERVRLEAMELYCEARSEAKEVVLDRFLDDARGRLVSAALGVVARGDPRLAEGLLDEARVRAYLERDGEDAEPIHAALAAALAGVEDEALTEHFWALATEGGPRVKAAAVDGLGDRRRVDAAGWLLERLQDRDVRRAARAALARCGAAVVPELARALADPARPVIVRALVARALGDIPHQDAVDALLARLPHAIPQQRHDLIRALARLRAYPGLTFPKELVFQAILREARVYTADRQAEAVLAAEASERPAERLLVRAVRERQQRCLEDVFALMGLRYDARDMANAYQGLISDKRAVRASALEFLDNLLKKRIRDVLVPILDPNPLGGLQAQARALFGESIESRYDALLYLLEGDDPWLRACALFALRGPERVQLERILDEAADADEPVVRETAARIRAMSPA